MEKRFLIWCFTVAILVIALGADGGDSGVSVKAVRSKTTAAVAEPPIYVTFNVHLDPVLDDAQKWRERKENLLWLKSFVDRYPDRYRPKLNPQLQGDQAEFYLDPNDPEAADGRAALAALYEDGHTFGTHMHNTLRGDAPHSWARVLGAPTPAQSVESWQDHITWVERLYAELTGNDDPEFLQQMNASAATILPPGPEARRQAFSGTYSDPSTGATVPHGFPIQTGGPNETFYCFFDHDVQNPWRPGSRGPLDEDLAHTAFIRIPQMPALGNVGFHGPIACYQDNSVPSRQRMFIQILLERLYHEYTGAEDKVWTFGWHEHLFDLYPTDPKSPGRHAFRQAVEEMVDWLNDRFIGRITANGNLIARYATVTEVRDAFLAWEAEHPGISSFEFTQYTSDWNAYPYQLKGLARELANAHYEAALQPPDSTLQVYRFERCPSSLRGEIQGFWALDATEALGCYEEASRDGHAIGRPLPTTTVYVAWRDAAEPERTDLTVYAGDRAVAYDGISGEAVAAAEQLRAYPLDFRPVVILSGTASNDQPSRVRPTTIEALDGVSAEIEAESEGALSASTKNIDPVPPLYFFYVIHTHVQGDWLPYTDPGMTRLDPAVADNMLAAIEGIAQVLERHGVKGTWEVVYGTSKGLCRYQGENHIFRHLLDAGHEVAVHAHRNQDIEPAFHNLQDCCGITPKTTSGFMGEVFQVRSEGAQQAISEAIEIALDLGMTVGTENLAPVDRRNPFGSLCGNQFGEGNDMWPETGNLMFPWKPDYLHRNICAHDPEGGMVLVDHVGPWWMRLPGQPMPDVLTDAHFDRLRQMFDAALQYMQEHRPERLAAWGFVTHLTEYAVGHRAENPPEPEALAALDRFLDYVAEKAAQGRVVFATASEIAELAFPSRPVAMPASTLASLHTAHEVERLNDGHTLITDGGRVRVGTESPIIEVDEAGRIVWTFETGINWAHSAERLPNGHTLIADTGHDRIIEVDAEGNIVWNSDESILSDGSHLNYPNDVDWLEDDHILITDANNHRAIEITRDGTIVWQFGETGIPGSDNHHLNGPHNADRLPNGNTIIADSNHLRVLEIAPDGTIVWQYRPRGRESLHWPRDADRLENGNTLITDSRNNRVIEVTPDGRIVWEYGGLNVPYEADRLSNGHTLISAALGGQIIEVDERGAIVWQYPSPSSTGYLLIPYNANYLWGPPGRVGRATKDQFVSTLNRHLDLMERLGIRADYYFTGLAAEKLAEWSPETVARLLKSPHGINYHGANRPPYPRLIDQVHGEDWEEDVATVRTYEVEGINPATEEHVGGLAAFRAVLGREPFATGRFFEASILYVNKDLGARMGVGLKDNTGASRDDVWFLGVLNRPTQAGLPASGLARAAIRGEDERFLAYARDLLGNLDGPFPVAVLPIHDHDFYKHPPADQEKVWDLYERVLRLALDLGYRVVTMREIYAMVHNGPAPLISRDELFQAAQELIETMEKTGYPPEYMTEGEMPYSLAEVFEGLVRALVAYRETGHLPDRVQTHDLLGPTEAFTSHIVRAVVSCEALLDAVAAVSRALTEHIPAQVIVDDHNVNSAEFLYLMAQEYVACTEGMPVSVTLRPIGLLPLSVVENQEADPLTRLQFWTYKPAVFAAR